MTFVGHFNQITDQLLQKLRAKANDKTPVTLLNELNRVALDAISSVWKTIASLPFLPNPFFNLFPSFLIHLVPFFKQLNMTLDFGQGFWVKLSKIEAPSNFKAISKAISKNHAHEFIYLNVDLAHSVLAYEVCNLNLIISIARAIFLNYIKELR